MLLFQAKLTEKVARKATNKRQCMNGAGPTPSLKSKQSERQREKERCEIWRKPFRDPGKAFLLSSHFALSSMLGMSKRCPCA